MPWKERAHLPIRTHTHEHKIKLWTLGLRGGLYRPGIHQLLQTAFIIIGCSLVQLRVVDSIYIT
uniref:Uncharacterized protein n=1 Tax=Rhizophora mucronata TaxID=61149 RepID=A0A2P2QV04_RHIMU